MGAKRSVLIIDPSAAYRRRVCDALAAGGRWKIATAKDVFQAAKKLRDFVPDAILMEVALPKVDGLAFIKKLMAQHPLPIVVCSQDPRRERAAGLGAVLVLEKGAADAPLPPIADALEQALAAKLRAPVESILASPKLSTDAVLPRFEPRKAFAGKTAPIVVVGASTGGTEALEELLRAMPEDGPPIAVVQHMPEAFTGQFATRLNEVCAPRVREAAKGMPLESGTVVIAPGSCHLVVRRAGTSYFCELREGPPVARHRPSVDVLFRSAALGGGPNVVAALLTGMGSDGARGMLELREVGASTAAQDERTSVVFGMPKEAIALGGVQQVLPLPRIAPFLLEQVRRRGHVFAPPAA